MFISQEMGVWNGKIYVSALTIKPREVGCARYGGRLREVRRQATRVTEGGYARYGGRCDDWVSTDQVRGGNKSRRESQQFSYESDYDYAYDYKNCAVP